MAEIGKDSAWRAQTDAICELHRIVTEDTLDNPDAAGAIQSDVKPKDRVKIFDQGDKVLNIPPPAAQLKERLEALCDFANSGYARSFMLTEQDSNDLTYFIIYQLNVLKRSLDDLSLYLERKVSELQATRSLLASTPGHFNHRQIVLLESATNDPMSEFTVRSHSKTHNVTAQTARNDLTDLHVRGFLVKNQIGKEFVFAPIGDLYAKLRDGASVRDGASRRITARRRR